MYVSDLSWMIRVLICQAYRRCLNTLKTWKDDVDLYGFRLCYETACQSNTRAAIGVA
jgi:hypothetical protein